MIAKEKKWCILFSIFFSVMLLCELTFAEQQTITLPKGTTVEKLGIRHFKFKLPNGQVVEVKNFNPKTGAIGLVGIINPDQPGVRAIKGKQGQLKAQIKPKLVKLPPGTEYVLIDDEVVYLEASSRLPKTDYVLIDDEPVLLPATIQFQPEPGLQPKPGAKGLKGLAPQPDPPARK